MKIKLLKTTLFLILSISVLILSACANVMEPFNSTIVNQSKDDVAPVITISTPFDEDIYGALTLLSGTVRDLSNNGIEGEVSTLTYEIVGISNPVNIPIEEDNSYQVILETSGVGYSGVIRIKLTATDWNGNSEETTVTLVKASGDITSFTVTPDNGSAELNWDMLPGAESYTIEELTTRESVSNILPGDFPYTWNNLTNGSLYSFIVSAQIGVDTFTSSTEYALPLSQSILTPRTQSINKGIDISWNSIPGSSSYILERSNEKNGFYSRIINTSETSYSDTNMDRDASYFYRVIPEELFGGPNEIYSNAVFGAAGFFPGSSESIVTSVFSTGTVENVTISGNYAYVADKEMNGVQIVDISDPEYPVVVGTYDDETAVDIAVSGNYAYIISGESSNFYILDISNPVNPVLVGTSLDLTGSDLTSIVVSGTYAYITQWNNGLHIVNIGDHENPSYITLDTDGGTDKGEANDVAVSGDYAYIADSFYGFQVVDILPVSLNYLEIVKTVATTEANGVTVSGNFAYIADYTDGLVFFDITAPVNTSIVDTIGTVVKGRGVFVSGNYAYVATSDYITSDDSGLSIITINEPGDPLNPPVLSAVRDTLGSASGVAVSGEYAFVADGSTGLQIIEIPLPAPVITDTSYGQSSNGVTVSGNYAYIAGGSNGLRIIDITDSLNPDPIGNLVTDDYSNNIKVTGNYAYVADRQAGLQIIDISDTSNPVLTGTCDTPHAAKDIEIKGDYAYIADFYAGLQIIDISKPAAPVIIGAYNTPGDAAGIALSGNYAFIADIGGGIIVIDISNPKLPKEVSTYAPANEYYYDVSIQGNYAYISDDNSFLRIIDISNPELLVQTDFLEVPGIEHIMVSGDYVYALGIGNNLSVIDISVPSDPFLMDELAVGDYRDDVIVSGECAYAVGTSGLAVIDLYPGN